MAYDNPVAAASQVIQVDKVYSGDTGTPMEEWKEIPLGNSSINVNFTNANFDVDAWVEMANRANTIFKLRESMAKIAYDLRVKATQAYAFEQHVRAVHKVPQDAEAWNRFKVDEALYVKSGQGHFRIHAFKFEDGSIYRAG